MSLSALLRMQPLGEGIGSDRAARAVVQQEKVHFFLELSIDKLFIQEGKTRADSHRGHYESVRNQSTTTGRAGGMRKAPKRGHVGVSYRICHTTTVRCNVLCLLQSPMVGFSPLHHTGVLDSPVRASRRYLELNVNSNGGCDAPTLVKSTSPIRTNTMLTAEPMLRERRSLVNTHQQSWWFTSMN